MLAARRVVQTDASEAGPTELRMVDLTAAWKG